MRVDLINQAGIPSSGGGTLADLSPSPAGTYAYPASVTLNAKGQATGATGGSAPKAPVIEVPFGVQAAVFSGTFALTPGNVDGEYPFGSAQTTYTSYVVPRNRTLKGMAGLPVGGEVTIEIMRYEGGSWTSKSTQLIAAGAFEFKSLNLSCTAGDNLCFRCVCSTSITALWAYLLFEE